MGAGEDTRARTKGGAMGAAAGEGHDKPDPFELVVLALGIFLLIKAKKCEREEKIKADFLKVAELKSERKAFLISSLTGTVVCAILWLVELFS